MSKPVAKKLDHLGRMRLSRHFYMRQFLYSEIGNAYGIPNVPHDEKLCLKAGGALARTCLDPLVETFGGVEIRSAYRSPEVNSSGNENGFPCGNNEWNRAHHIWDQRDKQGRMGATASIFIPWFTAQYETGRDWRDLAYWLHDHIEFTAIVFFGNQCSFNLNWRPGYAEKKIKSWITEKGGCPLLTKANCEPNEPLEARQGRYADFPPFGGLLIPQLPAEEAAE